MARTKRTSTISEAAKLRLAGLQSIDPALDLGGGLTVASFKADIDDLDADFNTYNKMLSDLDEVQNRLDTKEDKLSDKSTRFLAAVGARYDKDSDEYEKAGGTRTSERKKPGPRNKGGGGTPPTG
jgi:flagellin-like hook-associated protein FlgL